MREVAHRITYVKSWTKTVDEKLRKLDYIYIESTDRTFNVKIKSIEECPIELIRFTGVVRVSEEGSEYVVWKTEQLPTIWYIGYLSCRSVLVREEEGDVLYTYGAAMLGWNESKPLADILDLNHQDFL